MTPSLKGNQGSLLIPPFPFLQSDKQTMLICYIIKEGLKGNIVPLIYMSFYVYLLYASATSGQQTYVGATVDLDHRLRQHNKEIKGGAKATSIQVERGETWERVCHVEGFPTWQAALQFEWRFKQLTRKLPARMDPLERRMSALKTLISLDKSTSKAVPYSEWPSPLQVIVESEKVWHLTTMDTPYFFSGTMP